MTDMTTTGQKKREKKEAEDSLSPDLADLLRGIAERQEAAEHQLSALAATVESLEARLADLSRPRHALRKRRNVEVAQPLDKLGSLPGLRKRGVHGHRKRCTNEDRSIYHRPIFATRTRDSSDSRPRDYARSINELARLDA